MAADEGCTLFVAKSNATTAGTGEEAECTLENPNECKDGKGQGRPVHELGRSLVGKDGPERPGDRNGCREITFGGGEGVGSGCSFEEEAAPGSVAEKMKLRGRNSQGKEDKDFRPDTSMVVSGVDTECLEGAQNDEDGGPPVIQRERKVDENLISVGLGRVMLLHDVIDVLFIEMVRLENSVPDCAWANLQSLRS